MVQTILDSVYKARTLWANAEPGYNYNDLMICSGGSNKNDPFAGLKGYLESNSSLNQIQQVFIHKVENSEQDKLIHLYPNPTNGVVNVWFNGYEKGNCIVKIFDNTGRLVKTIFSNTEDDFAFNIADLSNGYYGYEIFMNTQLVKKGKLALIN